MRLCHSIDNTHAQAQLGTLAKATSTNFHLKMIWCILSPGYLTCLPPEIAYFVVSMWTSCFSASWCSCAGAGLRSCSTRACVPQYICASSLAYCSQGPKDGLASAHEGPAGPSKPRTSCSRAWSTSCFGTSRTPQAPSVALATLSRGLGLLGPAQLGPT